jgi:hypothetical protein
MGNSKLKPDEEWSQENLGDDLFDSYEDDAPEAAPEPEHVLQEVSTDPVVVTEAAQDIQQKVQQEAPLDLEPSQALLDLDFENKTLSGGDEKVSKPDARSEFGVDLAQESPVFDTAEERTTHLQLETTVSIELDEVFADAEESVEESVEESQVLVEAPEHSSVELIGADEKLNINDALPEKSLGEVFEDGDMDFDDQDSFGESSDLGFDFSENADDVESLESAASGDNTEAEESLEESPQADKGEQSAQFSDSSFDELGGSVASQALEATVVLGGIAGAGEPSIQDSNYDWRKYVGMRSAPQGTPKELLSKAFADDLEKHLGLQIVSLLSGERAELQNWKYAVWRDGNLRTYSHDGRSRVKGKVTEEVLRTDLRSAVFSLAPLLIQMHNDKFDFVEFMKEQKVTQRKIVSTRKQLAWDGPQLTAFGFGAYARRLQSRSYQAFQFDGLGETIFYDGRSRSIYFDLAYYSTKPVSWLLYGVLSKFWALRMGYLPFLQLDVMNDMLPTIEQVKKKLSGKKEWLSFKKSPVSTFLKSQYGKKVEMYANYIQALQTDQMFSVTNAMNLHIYKLLLADGLDLVGLLSYILQTDIASHADGASLMQTQQGKQVVGSLFEFAADLNFSPEE